MINTALSSLGPNSRFLCRSTMEHVYGILLDEKFLYRSVHAAFVNTKWYEAWLERTLLLDPIIFDMWGPGVLSWAPGQPCNSRHSRHTGQDTVVVPYLRFGSFLHHKSIGGRLRLLPRAARDGLALCHLSRQDTSRGVPSQGRHRSKVCACRR